MKKTSWIILLIFFSVVASLIIVVILENDKSKENKIIFGVESKPAAYVKDLVAYKEGSYAIVIYFILADQSGEMTTSDGDAEITISEIHSEWSDYRSDFIETEKVLYKLFRNVKKEHFRKTKIGMGAFEHNAIIYPIGRITYDSFWKEPSEMSGKIVIEFKRQDGKILKGEDTIIF